MSRNEFMLNPHDDIPRNALPFDEWYKQLTDLCVKWDCPISEPEAWRGYYDDDYTPREALSEDLSNL